MGNLLSRAKEASRVRSDLVDPGCALKTHKWGRGKPVVESTFPELAAGKSARDRIVRPDDVIGRAPNIIIGSWCGKLMKMVTPTKEDASSCTTRMRAWWLRIG